MTEITKLHQAAMGNSDALLFTVPTDQRWIVSHILLTSTSAADQTVRLHSPNKGVASSVSNALLYDFPVEAADAIAPAIRPIIGPGEELRGLASGGAVTLTVWGLREMVSE